MIIGLTGGIASGKSTIAKKMSERGAFVLDADKLGHRVYEPGRKAFDQVIEVFGGDIVAETGEIDRKILGGKVFGNPAELKKLTDIVWPAISAMASEEINENRANHPDQLIVVEAAVNPSLDIPIALPTTPEVVPSVVVTLLPEIDML